MFNNSMITSYEQNCLLKSFIVVIVINTVAIFMGPYYCYFYGIAQHTCADVHIYKMAGIDQHPPLDGELQSGTDSPFAS